MRRFPRSRTAIRRCEFYDPEGEHDCRSDLYSLGATFYHLITGEVPLAADLREEAIKAGAADPYEPLAAGKWAYDRGFWRRSTGR